MSSPTITPARPDAAALATPATARAWQAAQDFEALVLGQLLAPIFATVPGATGPFGGGQAEEAWRPMMSQEMGRHLARNGGLGLAMPVFTQILRLQEAADQARTAAAEESP